MKVTKAIFTTAFVILVSIFLNACVSDQDFGPIPSPPGEPIAYLTAENFHLATVHRTPTLVYFYRHWCFFCGQQDPEIQSLHDQSHSHFRIFRMHLCDDIESEEIFRYLFQSFDQVGVPAFVLFQNGEVLGVPFMGMRPADRLLEHINTIIG